MNPVARATSAGGCNTEVIQQVPEDRQTLLFTAACFVRGPRPAQAIPSQSLVLGWRKLPVNSEATWPREVRSLASEFLKRPFHVQTGAVHEMTVARPQHTGMCDCDKIHYSWFYGPSQVNKDIEQRVVFCSDEEDKATGHSQST